MRSLLVMAMALLAPSGARAELPLQPPEGWQAQKQEGALVIQPRDLGGGQLYTVLVPDLTMKVGSTRGLLDAARASLAQAGTFVPSGEPTRSRTDGGWEVERVAGALEKDGRALRALALGARRGDDEGIVIVIADGDATMARYAGAFDGMVRRLGGGAAPSSPPPAAGGAVDVRFRVPAGWTSRPLEGGVMIEKTADTMYEKYEHRLVVLPSQPLRDSLRKTYVAAWTALVAPLAVTSIAPLPLVTRLRSGAVVAYDTDAGAKNRNGATFDAGLFLVAQGNRYTPVVVLFLGGVLGDKVEADLTQLLESFSIPGAGEQKVTLFSPAELVGEWETSSASYASYVTASGGYAGDASVATGEHLTLRADGTFSRTLLAVSSSSRVRESDEGKWRVEDGTLVETGRGGAKRWSLFGVGNDPKAGAFLVMGTFAGATVRPRLCNPRGQFQATWFRRKP